MCISLLHLCGVFLLFIKSHSQIHPTHGTKELMSTIDVPWMSQSKYCSLVCRLLSETLNEWLSKHWWKGVTGLSWNGTNYGQNSSCAFQPLAFEEHRLPRSLGFLVVVSSAAMPRVWMCADSEFWDLQCSSFQCLLSDLIYVFLARPSLWDDCIHSMMHKACPGFLFACSSRGGWHALHQ